MTHSHTFTNQDLDNALKSLQQPRSKGIVLVGNTQSVTAVKLVDDAAESVLAVHCLHCSTADNFSKPKGKSDWIRTPYVGDSCEGYASQTI